MKFITNNIGTIILIALMIFLFLEFNKYRKEAARWQDNYEQKDSMRHHQLFKFTKKEFKEQHKKDSSMTEMMDSLKISWRHIERTINHRYTHIYDTTITHLYPAPLGTKSFYKKFDECLSISGHIDYEKDLLIFDKAQMSYSATSIYYWQRNKRIFKLIPFGRKKHFVETTNNCSGQTKVQEIEIIKK